MTARAVVFAYHDVGVRCLQVLQAFGVEIALVVTHEDHPGETCWFDSVAKLSTTEGWPLQKPEKVNSPALLQAVQTASPDFIFSFYYRQIIGAELLRCARRGAFNMHGSLLPHYRGCAPVNWAILHGETQIGATLHEMVARPDAGAIIGQTAVPIFPNDIASQVMQKVALAAEITLWNALPALLADRATRLPNPIEKGSYFGRRTPEDGRIDWHAPAQTVYNLIRAVAPPYPGAFTNIGAHRFVIGAARLEPSRSQFRSQDTASTANAPPLQLGIQVHNGRFIGCCMDGSIVAIHTLLYENKAITPAQFITLMQANTD